MPPTSQHGCIGEGSYVRITAVLIPHTNSLDFWYGRRQQEEKFLCCGWVYYDPVQMSGTDSAFCRNVNI